ncbi:MAG: hypothetical protein ACREHD_27440 [Pirellulales bacterium]
MPDSYISEIPEIYRDILAAFPTIFPPRAKGDGLSVQTLHAGLHEKYSLAEIDAACKELEKNSFVEIKHGVFVHPLEIGEELIAKLTGGMVPAELVPPLPPLPPPPVMAAKTS